MQNELLSFIKKFQALSQEEAEAIAEQITTKLYPKGAVLLREGEVNTHCYFVLKGCLRQYRLIDGVEKTIQFYTEEQPVTLFSSYTHKTVADCYIVCVEDSLVIVGATEAEAAMYEKFPKLMQITRAMMEQNLGKIQDDFAHFMASSPVERYLHLLATRPYLLQRVPQHQLASYLGVTPESLSRIRKRVATKS